MKSWECVCDETFLIFRLQCSALLSEVTMSDRWIVCIQSQRPFLFSLKEQERYVSQGFDFPKRRPECRENKHKSFAQGSKWRDGGGHRREQRKVRRDKC